MTEIKAKYDREKLIHKILDYIEMDYEGSNSQNLLNEILYLREQGCVPLTDYTTTELASTLVEHLDRHKDWDKVFQDE